MINIRCATFLVGVFACNLINLQFHHKCLRRRRIRREIGREREEEKEEEEEEKKNSSLPERGICCLLASFPFSFL